MVCLTRSLVAWILIAGTLFVASTIIRHITIMAGEFPFARPHGQNYWTKFDLHNYSYQQQSLPPTFSNVSLDVVSKIYVISLPRRTDRHLQMDRLKDVLHLNWTYKDAYEANASVVTHILRHVHALRSLWVPQPQPSDVRLQHGRIVATFDWPHDLEDGIYSQETLRSSGADLWALPSSHSLSDLAVPVETTDPYSIVHSEASSVSDSTSLACASGNNVFTTFSPKLPLYKRLTAAKVACWYSHFQVIRGIANGGDQAVLVLEDDVDIERDLKERLRPLWDALPNNWDIVYLGHCWSNESHFSALRNISLQLPSGRTTFSGLHPANSPKCTHAYVLSRIGARRIVAHLRHPPFAYSRAIDQALAWLVQSGRLRAFSIVPPVIMQRKIAVSDVMPGLGSAWRDELYDGVLAGVDKQS